MTDQSCSKRTTCPYCGVGCGVIAKRDEAGAVSVKGDPYHPANLGRLCSKGTALKETVGLEGRLLAPSLNGQVCSWDIALDTIAERFSQIIASDGPDAIGFYVSGQLLTEDYYAANKLMKAVIGSANIDTNSRLCMASSVAGHKRAFGSDTVPGCYEDFELADLVVLVGSNLAWCHPVLYQRLLAARKQRPEMKIVLIDPRRTMTADIADLHLAIKPDGDVALFLGLLAKLKQAGGFDEPYLTLHTQGIDAALQEAMSLGTKEILAATGLKEDALWEFYQMFARTEKTVTVYSQGVNQSRSGTDKVNAILNCHLATGRIGKPGMGPFSVTGQPNAMGGREVGGLANMLACHMDIENSDHRALVGEFWQTDRLPIKPGLKAVDMFKAVEEGRIKALWIMATNPVDSMPDSDRIRAAIKACPLVIVSDVEARTDTLDLADIKLPSLAWGEKQGTVTNSERCISRQRAFLPAPGKAKADWWQMAEVGRRMGFAALFDWQGTSDIFREYAALSGHRNEGTRDFDISRFSQISANDYERLAPFQWPARRLDNGERRKRFFADGRFFTPDSKARLLPVKPPAALLSDPQTLTLNTGRVRDQWHTMTRTGRSSALSPHIAEPFCEISPHDARARSIEDADLIRVENEQGSIVVRALVTKRVQPGQIFVPMHWTDQNSANARVDKLVPAVTDPFSGQPASKSAQVRVEKHQVASFGFAVLKGQPASLDLPYWAMAKSGDGWRLECAFDDAAELLVPETLLKLFAISEKAEAIHYVDQAAGRARYAWFDGDTLVGLLFASTEPVAVSRDFAAKLLDKRFEDRSARFRALASVAGADQPDKGKIICACMQVGANEIGTAIVSGCLSLDAVIASTGAGSNCGSCKPEISQMLEATKAAAE